MDRETALRLLRELTSAVEQEGLDEKVSLYLQQTVDSHQQYKAIDKQMVELLHTIFMSDSLNKKDAYTEVVKSIEQGSVVVYFKSAQLFKVYKKEDIVNLLDGQLRTDYKHIRESYEIVPKDSEQKIIIMGDMSLLDKLDSIKQYISQFMKNRGVGGFKLNDIICFKNDKTELLEIVINNYYVKNSEERNIIVHELLEYIVCMEKNTHMTRKLGPPSEYSDINGVDMITMPSEKQLINENALFIEMIDRLVRSTHNCSKLVKEGNTLIINVIGVQNNAEVINNNCSESDDNENHDYEFIKHIRNTKPSWYVENDWVKKDIVYDEYIKLYDDITKKKFAILFKDKLYQSETRKMHNGSRFTFVKLLKYDVL
jgi:hypothetical protein